MSTHLQLDAPSRLGARWLLPVCRVTSTHVTGARGAWATLEKRPVAVVLVGEAEAEALGVDGVPVELEALFALVPEARAAVQALRQRATGG